MVLNLADKLVEVSEGHNGTIIGHTDKDLTTSTIGKTWIPGKLYLV
jgi:hypothetical protein